MQQLNNNDDLNKALIAKTLIEKEVHRHYTIIELAQIVGSNKSSLNVAFKKLTGNPPKKHISLYRVEKAKYYMETTDLSIASIARKVGLDRRNLDRQFKKVTGLAPKEWRMSERESGDDASN